MSDIIFGGDSSVMWTVRADNARKSSIRSSPEGETGFLQSGVDESGFDKPFTIGIKIPQSGGEALAAALREAAEDAARHAGEPGYRVRFPLIIEPKNVDQVVVTWESTPPSPSEKPHDPLGSLIDKVKRVVRKVAGKKSAPTKSAPKSAAGKPAKKAKKGAAKAAAKSAPAKAVKKAGKKKAGKKK